MSDVFDDIIDREASPADTARVAAVIASDFRFSYFGTAAFAVRLLRLDQKLAGGIPMSPRRMSNILNTKPELMRWRGLFDSLMPFRRT
jgi:cytochrome c oxidase assembly factor CtaG